MLLNNNIYSIVLNYPVFIKKVITKSYLESKKDTYWKYSIIFKNVPTIINKKNIYCIILNDKMEKTIIDFDALSDIHELVLKYENNKRSVGILKNIKILTIYDVILLDHINDIDGSNLNTLEIIKKYYNFNVKFEIISKKFNNLLFIRSFSNDNLYYLLPIFNKLHYYDLDLRHYNINELLTFFLSIQSPSIKSVCDCHGIIYK